MENLASNLLLEMASYYTIHSFQALEAIGFLFSVFMNFYALTEWDTFSSTFSLLEMRVGT